MGIEVLKPLETKLVGCLAILRDSNNPIVRQVIVLVPGREVVVAIEDDEGWNGPPCCIDALDDHCPLLVPLLD